MINKPLSHSLKAPIKEAKGADNPLYHVGDLNVQTLLKYNVDYLAAPDRLF